MWLFILPQYCVTFESKNTFTNLFQIFEKFCFICCLSTRSHCRQHFLYRFSMACFDVFTFLFLWFFPIKFSWSWAGDNHWTRSVYSFFFWWSREVLWAYSQKFLFWLYLIWARTLVLGISIIIHILQLSMASHGQDNRLDAIVSYICFFFYFWLFSAPLEHFLDTDLAGKQFLLQACSDNFPSLISYLEFCILFHQACNSWCFMFD